LCTGPKPLKLALQAVNSNTSLIESILQFKLYHNQQQVMSTLDAWIECLGLYKDDRKIWVYSKRKLHQLDVAGPEHGSSHTRLFLFGHIHNPA
jgi:hypothetical protein